MDFAGYASTQDRDHAGHVVAPGAFEDSIRRRGLQGGKAIKLLAFHDSTKPLGRITKLETQADGRLLIEGEIDENISYGRDLAAASKAAGGLNFSVGFYLIDADWIEGPQPYLHILKGELTEVSVVVFPCNEQATMTATEKAEPGSLDALLAAMAKTSASLAQLKTIASRENAAPFSQALLGHIQAMKEILK